MQTHALIHIFAMLTSREQSQARAQPLRLLVLPRLGLTVSGCLTDHRLPGTDIHP